MKKTDTYGYAVVMKRAVSKKKKDRPKSSGGDYLEIERRFGGSFRGWINYFCFI